VYTTDWEIRNLGEAPTLSILYIEIAFLSWYTLEILLKLLVHRIYFFLNKEMYWNSFDLALIAVSSMEIVTIFLLSRDDAESNFNVSFLRSFRLFKLARVLRVFRTFRFITELRILLDSVLGSLVSLFWCTILLVFILYIFALLIVQTLTYLLQGIRVRILFGSVLQAAMTLFQSATGGIDWGDVYVLLLSVGGPLLAFLFVAFVLFFTIAAWNIITSRFVDKALKCSQPDLETLALEQKMNDMKDGAELMSILKHSEWDRSSVISYAEFKHAAEDPRLRSYLHVRGIDVKNVDSLFNMLSAGESAMPAPVFVNSLLRLKGLATSIDLHAQFHDTKALLSRQEACMRECTRQLKAMERLIGRRSRDGDRDVRDDLHLQL